MRACDELLTTHHSLVTDNQQPVTHILRSQLQAGTNYVTELSRIETAV
jgi:hypothetical protein